MPEGLRYRERPAAGDPEGLLVLFHGRGADEHNLVPLLRALDPDGLFDGYTPRGPLSLPPDYERLRERLEQVLTPLPDPRAAQVGR